MNETLVQINNISKIYPTGEGGFLALNKLSLDITDGEFMGIVGPSGSGKTTLLNIIGTLDEQTSGEVLVLGKHVNKLSSKESASLRANKIGFIFQTYNLLPVYTVYENVELPLLLLQMKKEERRKAVMQALEWVGLTDKMHSRPNQLSGGQGQRVSIARAMVKTPRLVIADEPTANLDTENSINILDTMLKINQDIGTTFIFSTHDPKVIQYLKRVVTLIDGEKVKDDYQTGI
ncbi:MAG: lipoprotein-releasing system ATP-binding protein LolD [Candidatus Cloacimonetes bacterium HGW-Cloacimonetes-1]|jgi:putative ABC transport system ATP-binding protein|nr:MAG: lipoprotein-releasing system ATP-binding protein LolD [Candidatus Cloacimonetes bacterium HGW-Cloacimonetes-1]